MKVLGHTTSRQRVLHFEYETSPIGSWIQHVVPRWSCCFEILGTVRSWSIAEEVNHYEFLQARHISCCPLLLDGRDNVTNYLMCLMLCLPTTLTILPWITHQTKPFSLWVASVRYFCLSYKENDQHIEELRNILTLNEVSGKAVLELRLE